MQAKDKVNNMTFEQIISKSEAEQDLNALLADLAAAKAVRAIKWNALLSAPRLSKGHHKELEAAYIQSCLTTDALEFAVRTLKAYLEQFDMEVVEDEPISDDATLL